MRAVIALRLRFEIYFAFKRKRCDGLYYRRCAVLRRFALCGFALFCVLTSFAEPKNDSNPVNVVL